MPRRDPPRAGEATGEQRCEVEFYSSIRVFACDGLPEGRFRELLQILEGFVGRGYPSEGPKMRPSGPRYLMGPMVIIPPMLIQVTYQIRSDKPIDPEKKAKTIALGQTT